MHYDDDGSLVGSFRIPPEDAPIVAKGITSLIAPPPTQAERDVSAETPTLRQRQADALVELADRGLNNGVREGDERVMAVIEVEAHVLSGRQRRNVPGPTWWGDRRRDRSPPHLRLSGGPGHQGRRRGVRHDRQANQVDPSQRPASPAETRQGSVRVPGMWRRRPG